MLMESLRLVYCELVGGEMCRKKIQILLGTV
jgi:hypothetical protein